MAGMRRGAREEGDGSRTWRGMLAEVDQGEEQEEMMAAQRSGDDGIARTAEKNPWLGQGVAAVVAAVAVAAAATAV